MVVAFKILNENSFASLQVDLPPGSAINSENDAVVSFSESVTIGGHVRGGIFGGMIRKLVFGQSESFFTQHVSNSSYEQRGDVLVAPVIPGGILLHRVDNGQDLLFRKGSFLASDTTVEVSPFMQYGITNSMFSGTGFFVLRAHGKGTMACSSFGSIQKYTLARGEKRAVDNGHVVAWTASMPYQTRMAGSGVWGSMTSGEGLTCEFTGPGTVYVQTHNLESVMNYSRGDGGLKSGGGSANQLFAIVIIFLIVLFMAIVAIMSNNFEYIASSNMGNDFYGNRQYSSSSRGYDSYGNQRGRTYEL